MNNDPKPGTSETEVYHHEADNLPAHSHHDEEVLTEQSSHEYWKANIRLVLSLLSIWFIVSFGFGILLVDHLNQFSVFGYKLGFWWAQQGAIYVFIILIFIYVIRVKKIDRRYGVDDDD